MYRLEIHSIDEEGNLALEDYFDDLCTEEQAGRLFSDIMNQQPYYKHYSTVYAEIYETKR